MSSDDKVEIKKSLNETDVQIKTDPTSTTYISTKPKKNRNRRLKKIRDHPYDVKRESIGMKKTNEIIKRYSDLRKKELKKSSLKMNLRYSQKMNLNLQNVCLQMTFSL